MKKTIFFTLFALSGYLQTKAQDTYWGLNDNKRLNTKTHKVIDSRPDDADVAQGLSISPRCIFDATGRAMFAFNRTSSDWISNLYGGISAFPIYNGKCKQYMVVNLTDGPGLRYVSFQKVDADGYTGEIHSLIAAPIAAPADYAGGADQQNIVVVPKSGGGHYVYSMVNAQDPYVSSSWSIRLTRYNIDADGTVTLTPTLINYGLPPIGGIAKASQDRNRIAYRTTDNHLVVFNVSNGLPIKDIAIGSDIYGIENYGDKWFYSTNVEMGYITETGTSKTTTLSGTKSDLSLAADGVSIFFGVGNPATGPGSLGYFDVNSPNIANYVPSSGGLVYNENNASFSLGNMVTSENTSIADGFDEYAPYRLPAGNTTWTPTSNPGAVFNGGTYPVYRLNTTVTIPSGSTLTLQDMKIEMGPEAKILVAEADEKKGWAGYLKMDNSTITAYSGCGANGNFWAGIQLFGKGSTYPQMQQDPGNPYSFHHAKLEMINKSELSHARLAVQTIDATDYTYTKGGGIINATNSYFLNNKKSVAFAPFQPTSPLDPNITYPELSFFTECEFKVNEPLSIGFVGFVSGSNLRGTDFLGCDFLNDFYKKEDNSYGINGYEFGFGVNKTTSGKRNYFRNLNRAIDVSNTGTSFTILSVRNATFENNVFGIKLQNVKLPLITGNEFLVPRMPNRHLEDGIGVILDECYKYQLANNHFTGIGAAPTSFYTNTGAAINACGPDDNSVHSNVYTDLECANLTTGNNGDYNAGTGLRFECNTYNNNAISEYIRSGNIALDQGSPIKAAGNTFNGGAGYNKISNGGNIINYFYGPGANEDPTASGVINVNVGPAIYGNDCNYDGDGPLHGKRESQGNSLAITNHHNITASVLPNPMHDNLTVKYQQSGALQIIDMFGKVLITEQLSGKQSAQQVDVSNLVPGTYFYVISASNQIIQRGKLVKD